VGVLEDPFGHRWSFATHIEDVSPEEMQKRAAAPQRRVIC
jgi:PhnB protein